MPAWPYVPGVPAAGHVAGNGYWHPGRIEGCPKCPPDPPAVADGDPRLEPAARAFAGIAGGVPVPAFWLEKTRRALAAADLHDPLRRGRR